MSSAADVTLPVVPRDAIRAACWRQVLLMGLIVGLAMPAFVGAAGLMRMVFPVAIGGIAFWLLVRHSFSVFLTFVLWTFMLTPFVRRIVDMEAGWQTVNILMVAPYLAASLCLGSLVPLITPSTPSTQGAGPRSAAAKGHVIRGRGLLLAVFASVAYGLILALIHGHISNGAFDFLRWSVPPALATSVLINRRSHQALWTEVEAFMLVATPASALYGLYQYIFIPSWDAFWMENVDMNTIGSPLPYQVRIFGTLNSPGPYSFVLALGIVLLLCSRHRLRWLGITTGMLALLLSFVRTSWLGLAVCLAFMALAAPRSVRLSMLGLGAVVVLVPALLLLNPDLSDNIAVRLGSFGNLSQDESATQRLMQYSTFVDALNENPLGAGLALHGATASEVDVRSYEVIDGGFIEIYASLGLIGGTVYLFAMGSLVLLSLVRPPGQAGDMLDAGYRAFAVSGLFMLLSGTCTIGEGGMFFWLSVAMPLVAGSPSPGDLAWLPGRKRGIER